MDDIPNDVLIALSLIEPEAFLVRTVYGTHKFRERGKDKGKGKDKGNKKGKRKDKGKVQRKDKGNKQGKRKGKDNDEGGVWRNI